MIDNSGSLKTILVILTVLSISSCNKNNIPVITTFKVTGISQVSASSGGKISNYEKADILSFGVCWSTDSTPSVKGNKTVDEAIEGVFRTSIPGLSPDTKYYVSSYVTNSRDTVYGEVLEFRTLKPVNLSDIDGNAYNAVTINTQTWMTENLKTTRYNDGTSIPLISGEAAWSGLSGPGYCWYRNDPETYKTTYGAFYNWYTVNSRKLCPTGWHVPSDEEWEVLTNYLGGETIAGSKLKKTGKALWVEPNLGATNETGFTALPGGLRYHDGLFHDFGFSGYWWTSTEYSRDRAYFRYLSYEYTNVFRFNNLKKIGFSVRCIQDK